MTSKHSRAPTDGGTQYPTLVYIVPQQEVSRQSATDEQNRHADVAITCSHQDRRSLNIVVVGLPPHSGESIAATPAVVPTSSLVSSTSALITPAPDSRRVVSMAVTSLSDRRRRLECNVKKLPSAFNSS